MQENTIFTMFSMTKPIICTALMLLYEEGLFHLMDPVSKFIPGFSDLQVFAGGTAAEPILEPLHREVTVRDLLAHTSGLTYHWLEDSPVEAMYRQAGVATNRPLSDFVAALLKQPLAFQPGTKWRYSFSHDVVAYLIEIISGESAASFLQSRLFGPLGMADTGYYVPADKLNRYASMYGAHEVLDTDMTVTKWFGAAIEGVNRRLSGPHDRLESAPHEIYRGGHGLVSTANDYHNFCQMLLHNGKYKGQQIMGRKTVELMTTNHLAEDLLPYNLAGFDNPGFGYGLGFSVVHDVAQTQMPGSIGTFAWGGAANTTFWIDPPRRVGRHSACSIPALRTSSDFSGLPAACLFSHY